MKYTCIILFAFFFTSCKENKPSINKEQENVSEVKNDTIKTVDIDLEIYDFNGFKKYLNGIRLIGLKLFEIELLFSF